MVIRLFACLALVHSFAFPSSAHAYLDPGTGSIILQGLLAGVVALGIYARTARAYVVGFFTSSRAGSDDGDESRREAPPA